MDTELTAKVLAFVAFGLTAVAAAVRALREDLTGALTAAGLSLLAFAAAIAKL